MNVKILMPLIFELLPVFLFRIIARHLAETQHSMVFENYLYIVARKDILIKTDTKIKGYAYFGTDIGDIDKRNDELIKRLL